jgi:SWI/SNF-related matrix-associated actin-dependent regulator of chromatin subfamily A member 5
LSSLSSGQEPDKALDPNVWASKPAWCQPWSILATGVLAVGASYTFSDGNLLVTAIVAAPVLVWWWLFLVLMPGSYRDAVLEYNQQLGTGRQ